MPACAGTCSDHTTHRLIGAALALQPTLRQRLRLIAKVGIVLPSAVQPQPNNYHYDSSAVGLRKAIATSFRDLGVERIDLLLLHRMDFLMRPEQVAEVLQPMLADVRIGGFGVSDSSAVQLDLMAAHLPVVAHQFELSVRQTRALDDGTHAHSQLHRAPVQQRRCSSSANAE